MKFFSKFGPALAGSLLFCLILAGMAFAVVRGSHGIFVYPLDDSYIHLALARTLARYHVWGIGPYEFGSASSSPGWTVLLTVFDLLFGSHLLNAILLNALCAIGLLFTVDAILRSLRPDLSPTVRFVAQLALLFCVPLPNLAFIGMEHVAQAWSIILVCALAARVLALRPEEPVPPGLAAGLVLTIFAAGTIRYEAVFAVLPIGLGLVLRRRIPLAIAFAIAAAIGPVAFGLYSHHLSGFWLPFSVMMKAQMEKDLTTGSKLGHFFERNANGSMLQFLLIPILLWVIRSRRHPFWSAPQLLLLLSACVTGLHLLLAPTRWLMRYESYFVALLVVAVVAALPAPFRLGALSADFRRFTGAQRAATAALAFVLIWLSPFLASRMLKGITQAPASSIDRYDEHVQMARFVKQYFDKDTIVVNDIGAVAFYSDAKLLDLYGLGSELPIRIVREHKRMITRDEVQAWAASNNASIAILQPEPKWMREHIPPTWVHIADWRTPRNLVFGDRTIGFYAIQPGDVARLCQDLAGFHLTPEDHIVPQSAACPEIAQNRGTAN